MREVDPDVRSVLLIGHNPGLQELTVTLVGSGDAGTLGRLREKLPTGALVTLTLPFERWSELEPGSAELAAYVVPRELG